MSKKLKPEDVPKGISEVCVRLPKVKLDTNYGFFWPEKSRLPIINGKRTMFIPCKFSTNTKQLKEKLSSKLKIPMNNMLLLFLGEKLIDDEILPQNAFEITTNTDSDDDIFRPRIFLSIIKEDLSKSTVIQSSSSTPNKFEEQAIDLKLDKVKSDEQNDSSDAVKDKLNPLNSKISIVTEKHDKKNEKHVDDHGFNLANELEKIDCAVFYNEIMAAGYGNEGAFSALEDEDLQVPGLWIPRRSRVRILTLAGTYRRKLAVFNKQKEDRSYKNFEKSLLGSGLRALTIEGDDKVYTTKAQLNKAWEKKLKDDLEAGNKPAKDKNKPKDHPHHIQEIIDKIRLDNLRDVDGLSLNPKVVKTDCKYCCNKHEHESTERKKLFVEQRRLNNIYQLDNYIASADTYKNGYIPRDVLAAFIVESVHSNFHKPITNDEIESILDSSLMNPDEQEAKQDWAGERERRFNLGKVPIPQYDTRKFIKLVSDKIASLDVKVFVECSD